MTNILLTFCILVLICLGIFAIKNNVTFYNHMIITDAIFAYTMFCIRNNKQPVVNYNDEEDYDKTLFRIWDWGYTKILPPDKFEIIKPFIQKR